MSVTTDRFQCYIIGFMYFMFTHILLYKLNMNSCHFKLKCAESQRDTNTQIDDIV